MSSQEQVITRSRVPPWICVGSVMCCWRTTDCRRSSSLTESGSWGSSTWIFKSPAVTRCSSHRRIVTSELGPPSRKLARPATVGPNHPSNVARVLNLRLFYDFCYFLNKLAWKTTINDRKLFLLFFLVTSTNCDVTLADVTKMEIFLFYFLNQS